MITKYAAVALLLIPLAGCKSGLMSTMKKSNWENSTMNNAVYDMPKKELWRKLGAYLKTRTATLSYNKKKSFVQTNWAIASLKKNTQKRLAYRVTIVGAAQPFKLRVEAKQDERFNKKGKWSKWRKGGNSTLEKKFKKDVYEHFNGPLVYDAKKVSAQQSAADNQKQAERRKRMTRKKLSSDEWLEQSRKRMQRDLNK